MSKKPFDKFINKPEGGAKKKEKIRQEKKKARAEKNAYFDEQKKLAWERRTGKVSSDKPKSSRDESKNTRYRNDKSGAKPREADRGAGKSTSFGKESNNARFKPNRSGDKPREAGRSTGKGTTFGKESNNARFKPNRSDDKPREAGRSTGKGTTFGKESNNARFKPNRSDDKPREAGRSTGKGTTFGKESNNARFKPNRSDDKPREAGRSTGKSTTFGEESNKPGFRPDRSGDKPKDTGRGVGKSTAFAKESNARFRPNRSDAKPKDAGRDAGKSNAFVNKRSPGETRKPAFENKGVQKRNNNYPTASASSKSSVSNNKSSTGKQQAPAAASSSAEGEMPLNKFIAWSGVCGRREAADLVKSGKVTVNGKVIMEPPHRVSQQDVITVHNKKITIQKNLVYILLNKPKDYITTTDDPEGRKTVMDLVKSATTERIFPVGRLDRNTTGVMLLTNDGELAQRLTHPKYEVKKIYEVRVDKVVTKQQLDTIANGITLEDGFIQPDMVAFADAKDKSIIGIEIHSGRNRIVRRIFEHLGFDVKNLDRVMYGIFTKKNVERGKWRMLTEKEVRLLKHLNTSFKTKKPS